MKNLISAFTLTLVSITLFAQYVEVDEKPMSTGINHGFTVEIDGLEEKTVQKEWQSFLKEYSGRSKRDRKSGEVQTTRAAIGGIGGDVNVYAITSEIGSKVKVSAFFESDGIFVSDDEAAQVDVAVGLMERFIVHTKRVRVEMELEGEEKTMKDLQKDLDKEERNEQRQHDTIEKCEKQIQEAEAAIVESQEMQKLKAEEIAEQQKIVEAVKVRLNNVSLEDEVEKMDEEVDEEQQEEKE